jgi:hypothetical protein
MKYTKELLEDILKEGGGTVLETYEIYNQRLRVKFICSCGVETSKRFEMLNVHRLPYCEGCSLRVKEQRKQETNLNKYGCINTASVQEVKDKINATFKEKYGGHALKSPEIIAKRAKTCLEKYGGHPNQNKEVQAKSEATSYKFRDYMMPSGKIVKVQGYENIALDELVKKYKEEDIVVGRSNIPTIEYHINDVKHVYFPDFFIKSENKIIEVKSEWTIQLRRGNVQEKALATIKAGYNYEIWIYNDKKVKVETRVY